MAGRYKSADEIQAIEAEAARRYLNARAGDTQADWDAAYAWVALDPAHGFAFAKAEASWELAERLNELSDLRGRAAPSEDTAAVIDQTFNEGANDTAPFADLLPRRFANRRTLVGMAVAAALIGVASTVALRLIGTVDHYRTALGETRAVRLDDGSVVRLNTGSSIEVAMRDSVRSIKLLKGEARFDVAHDRNRPFIVDADGTQVRAVGTAFNVRLRADLTELTVIEGEVAVKNEGSTQRHINAGKSAAVRSGSIAVTPLAADQLKRRVAWEDGKIEFDGDTLEQAVAEFNRYRATPLVIGDPAIASMRVGGTFRSGRSDDFVLALEHGFGVRAVAGNDDSVILVPAQ
ncbi:FecR domain-containing protein [Sphingobium sp. CR2-8]|uniref:FecR family protein n=1 Tax=Sphingobium sp. CR2-8 TaxID=1306534 RepID=UPI002DBC7EE1|nr:FecR domain-containing protein [Sphingobium sp. CR2-8]MEC3909381.1 FecR domain-containing protein [Sphingobium sp. CR2-8]